MRPAPLRLAPLLLAPLLAMSLGACALPFGGPSRQPAPQPAPQATRQDEARLAACRAEATRIVQYRDRGQQMRTDEADSRLGTLTTATPYSRAESDRAGQQIERDRLVAECLRGAPIGGSPPGGR